jgi:acyl-coenzyme A thioesterase PaaI-like protein
MYDHLGIHSRVIDETSGETHMPTGDDVRVAGVLRAAPLGLAFEQGVATYVYKKVLAVPVQIQLHVRDVGVGIEGIRSETHQVRLGRSLVVTDGEIRDILDPDRLVAYGSIIWSVIGPAPDMGEAPADRPPHQSSDVPIGEATGIETLEDGTGVRLPGVSPQATGPGGILHAGMFQLLSEDAALTVARRELGDVPMQAVDCTYDLLDAGREGPFVARATIVCSGDQGIELRVNIRDEGNKDRLCCAAWVRVVPVG